MMDFAVYNIRFILCEHDAIDTWNYASVRTKQVGTRYLVGFANLDW